MTHRRIEQASTDSKPHPSIHGERETKRKADIEQSRQLVLMLWIWDCVGDLGARESKEEEEKRPDEFSSAGHEVVASSVVEAVSEWQPLGTRLAFLLHCLCRLLSNSSSFLSTELDRLDLLM